MEFYNSSKYNPDYRYSFIYPNPVQPRTLCPKCGNNTYKGYTEDLEWGIDPMPCPMPSPLTSDMVTNYHHNVWSACDTCGYKTSKTFQGIQLFIGPSQETVWQMGMTCTNSCQHGAID